MPRLKDHIENTCQHFRVPCHSNIPASRAARLVAALEWFFQQNETLTDDPDFDEGLRYDLDCWLGRGD